MGTRQTRRALGLAASLAVTGAALLSTAGVAFAADSLHLNVQEYNLTLPKAVNGVAVQKTLHINVAHDLQGHVPSATLTIDAGGLAGVADVIWPSGCTHTGTVGTCTVTHVWTLGDPGQPVFLALGLKAAPNAKDGASGTVDLKATAPGLASDEEPQTITVGSGADLTVQQLPELNHVKVGSTLTAPIRWTNTGNETAPSTVITLDTMAGLAFQQHFSNCKYSKPTGALNDITAVCTINTPLAPGHALQLSQPIKLGVTTQAWYSVMSVGVLPPGAQTTAVLAHASGYTAGAGPELTAVDATSATAGAHPNVADINPRDSYTELDIHADNTAHYSAVGGSANGAKGKTVPVTVGMRNNGPAAIYDRSGGEGTDALRVSFPAGTTVTTVPNGCDLDTRRHGVAGHGPYECNASYAQLPGYQVLYTFRVHLDAQLTNARGTAALTNLGADLLGKPVTFPWDRSTAGYVAPIVFNGPQQTTPTPTPSSGHSSAPSSAPAAGSGGSGGAGGGLAHTGGGGLAMPLSVGGAAAVALGSAVVVLSRRRARAQHS